MLVEGDSDRVAVETLARRRGRDLPTEGIAVVAMGGAHAIGRFLAAYGPQGRDLRLAGLYDLGVEPDIRRGLERAGLGAALTRDRMEARGFFVCVTDLEDELIRALGVARIEPILEEYGDLAAFRTLQKQPAQRGRTAEAQLRRFMGAGSGRKIRYARLLVEALELTAVPRPLDGLLDHI